MSNVNWFRDRFVQAGIIATRKLTVAPVIPDFTAAVEYGDAVQVVVQLKDADGVAVARTVECKCEILLLDGLLATSAEFTLSENGTGTEISRTGKPTLIVSTSSTGACTIVVQDVPGSYVGDAYLVITPLNTFGSPGVLAITFA